VTANVLVLSQVKPHVDHTWVRLGQDESAVDDALLAGIQKDPDYKAGRARVLVFTRNTVNADRVRAPWPFGVADCHLVLHTLLRVLLLVLHSAANHASSGTHHHFLAYVGC
jgi:hypothetical protein